MGGEADGDVGGDDAGDVVGLLEGAVHVKVPVPKSATLLMAECDVNHVTFCMNRAWLLSVV